MKDKDFIKKKAKLIYPFVIYGKLNSNIESDYISKDKIREKIKELEKEKNLYEGLEDTVIYWELTGEIQLLKDLIEEA